MILFSNQVLIISMLGLYLTFLTGVNYYIQKLQGDTAEYTKLQTWIIALSTSASDNSGWLFLGLPGTVYLLGLNQAWIVIGLILGYYCNWLVVAPYLKAYLTYHQNPDITELFQSEFPIHGYIIKELTSWIIIFFSIIYISANLISLGLLFSTFQILDYHLALIGTTIFLTLYVIMSGFTGVHGGDIVQACMMLLASIGVMIVGLMHTDIHLLIEEKLNLKQLFNLDTLQILSLMSWGLGYFGQPHILTKFLFIKDQKMIQNAKTLSLLWSASCWIAMLITGLISSLLFHQTLVNPEIAFIQLVQTIMSPGALCFIIVSVTAAIISTVTTQILVTASILKNRFCTSEQAKHNQQLNVSILGVMLVNTILALSYQGTVLTLVSYAWSGLGASIGPLVLLLSIGWKLSEYGVIISLSMGVVLSALWRYFQLHHYMYELLPVFIIVTVSLILTKYLFKANKIPFNR